MTNTTNATSRSKQTESSGCTNEASVQSQQSNTQDPSAEDLFELEISEAAEFKKTADENASSEELFDLEISEAERSTQTTQVSTLDRHVLALQTVNRASKWSSAAGLIPVPFLDSVGVTGVQIKMIFDLCKIYDVPCEKNSTYAIGSGLMAAIVAGGLAQGIKKLMLSSAPTVGPVISLASEPAIFFAATFALGRVFIQHLENQGTLKDFDFTGLKPLVRRQFSQSSQAFRSTSATAP